jgi:hypothetical protein
MQSRRNGDFKHSVLSALAALVAAAVPTLIASPALAEAPAKSDAPVDDGAASKGHAKADAKKTAKPVKKAAPAAKGQKPAAKKSAAKSDAPAKPAEAHADAKPKQAKADAAPKNNKVNKTAARATGTRKKTVAKKSDADAPRRCLGAPVTLDRGGLEGQSVVLVDCHQRPLDEAQRALSVLARPWGAAKPGPAALAHPEKTKAPKGKPAPAIVPGEIAPGVRLVDKGLLARIDAIARHFPGRPISLVSGYRPQSRGSMHQSARALDLRVAGVTNEELVAFCKTLPDTGCGYYPNSSFVHVDARNKGTGNVHWIDASGPGEAPRYVTQWPPPDGDDPFADKIAGDERHDEARDPWEIDPPDAPDAGDDAKLAPGVPPWPEIHAPSAKKK